jgi:predicted ArsR family transcriptional regulator
VVDRQAIAAVAALSDPTRAAVFEWTQASDRPVTREDVAAALGISRKLAAFHLDRLVAAGLLSTAVAAPKKVGRAPRLYRPSERHVEVSVPPRNPEAAAEMLLGALTEVAGTQEAAVAAVTRTAADRGRAVGAELSDRRRLGRVGPERALTVLNDLLNAHGYLAVHERDCIRLRNCPFRPLATQAAPLVCAMNHAFISGMVDGLDARGVDAVLRPDPAGCCVRICRAGGERPGPVDGS